MEFNSPQTVNSGSSVPMTVHSSPQIVDSSTPSVRIVAPAVVETVSSTHRSETIEHVISSPRNSVSSEELDVLEARAEAARAAQQAAEARLASEAAAKAREAAAARVRLLEARARSGRTSRTSRASAPVPREMQLEDVRAPVNLIDFELPIQENVVVKSRTHELLLKSTPLHS